MSKQKYKNKYYLAFLMLMVLSVPVTILRSMPTVSAQTAPAMCAVRSTPADAYRAMTCSSAGYSGLENGKYYMISSIEEALEISLGNRSPREVGQTEYRESVIDSCSPEERQAAPECSGVTTRAERTKQLNRSSDIEADCTIDSTAENCGITRYIVLIINILSALAGIAIAGAIAYGGIQYSMSGSDPQKVSEAKNRIRNAIIALVFFIFGYSILNYLIPGGVL